MIILKLNIEKINLKDINKDKDFPSLSLDWRRGTFEGKLYKSTIDLIEKVSNEQYEAFDENSVRIKSINFDYGVPVYLDDKDNRVHQPSIKVKRKIIEQYISELQNEVNRLKKEKGREDELKRMLEVLETWEGRLSRSKQDPNSDVVELENNYTRLGYYTRNGRDHNPEIVLLMGNISDDKQLLISTYIHEMFHAYYDWNWLILSPEDKNHAISGYDWKKYKYVEEPLTEYAMLKFLENFVRNKPEYADLLDVAARNVSEKQLSPEICHYGFGYYLWKWERDGNNPLCNWIKRYKEAKFKICDTQDKHDFESPFSKGLYPFGKEKKHMELLREILK